MSQRVMVQPDTRGPCQSAAESALECGDLRRAMLLYYRKAARELPWRGESDPYRIWVSEIMLQQTQVITVSNRYRSFIKRFPNVRALAKAPLGSVCEEWAGLGYYARARNLHAAARVVAKSHDGRLPTTAAALETLPGIGRYTAAAVASIAFGEPVAVVDGNVARLLARLFALDESPSRAAGQKRIRAIAGKLVSGPRPGDLNQAMMELGACICTPRAPDCARCPLAQCCGARAQGAVESFPRRVPARTSRSELALTFAWLEDAGGVWLERRPPRGLWGGQWQLPSEHGRGARSRLALRLKLKLGRTLARIDHELTHRHVRATVLHATTRERLQPSTAFRQFRNIGKAPVSSIARRAIDRVLANRAEA